MKAYIVILIVFLIGSCTMLPMTTKNRYVDDVYYLPEDDFISYDIPNITYAPYQYPIGNTHIGFYYNPFIYDPFWNPYFSFNYQFGWEYNNWYNPYVWYRYDTYWNRHHDVDYWKHPNFDKWRNVKRYEHPNTIRYSNRTISEPGSYKNTPSVIQKPNQTRSTEQYRRPKNYYVPSGRSTYPRPSGARSSGYYTIPQSSGSPSNTNSSGGTGRRK